MDPVAVASSLIFRHSRLPKAIAFRKSGQPAPNKSLVATNTLDLRPQKRALTNKSASAFDNFHTPQNDFFYSRSPYLPLDSMRQEVRLLKVFPRKSYIEHLTVNPQWSPRDANGRPMRLNAHAVANLAQYGNVNIANLNSPVIACELVDQVALSRVDGTYCTLSYCAGKPTDTAVILVDGLPFNAFANLEHAIGHALECWTSRNLRKELLLWVDQICIYSDRSRIKHLRNLRCLFPHLEEPNRDRENLPSAFSKWKSINTSLSTFIRQCRLRLALPVLRVNIATSP